MNTSSIKHEQLNGWHRVTFNRPEQQNTLTPDIVVSLANALTVCENDSSARAFVIEGSGEYFSNGMDLVSAAEGGGVRGGGEEFLQLLKRFIVSPVVIVSMVDGKARGGGVGIVAASDFVYATPRSQFSLPEILWGLLPCTIAPFLIRRVGYRVCQQMTLSTLPVNSKLALDYGLVDSIEDHALSQLLQRLQMVAPEAIGKAKQYLSKLWIMDDAMLNGTLDELDILLKSTEVSQRLNEFKQSNTYPWEQLTNRVISVDVDAQRNSK